MYHKFRDLTLTAALITVGLINQSILHADFKLVDVSYDRLTAFDQSGAPTTLVSGLGNENPSDVAFDSTGNMYVTYYHELSGTTEVHEFSTPGHRPGNLCEYGARLWPCWPGIRQVGQSIRRFGKHRRYREIITDGTGSGILRLRFPSHGFDIRFDRQPVCF